MYQHNQEHPGSAPKTSTSSSSPNNRIYRIPDRLSEPEGTFTRMGETRKKPEIVRAKDRKDFVGVTPITEYVNEPDRKGRGKEVVYAIVQENPSNAEKKQYNTLRRTKALWGDPRDLNNPSA